jgi:hypothetical protein
MVVIYVYSRWEKRVEGREWVGEARSPWIRKEIEIAQSNKETSKQKEKKKKTVKEIEDGARCREHAHRKDLKQNPSSAFPKGNN